MVDILQVLSSPLGQKILGIYFTSTSLSVLLSHYSEKYIYNKYIMPYLRGAKSLTKYPAPASVQNQLNQLKRKVAQNTPAKVNHQRQYALSPAPSGVSGANINVTDDFISATEYRDLVNGDSYTNHTLRLCIKVKPEVSAFRVIVYSPKVTSSSYAIPTSDNNLTRYPDPAAFAVYHDSWVTRQADLDESIFFKNINLRRLTTVYNGSSSTLEKGAIRVMVEWSKGGGSTVPGHITTMLILSDK